MNETRNGTTAVTAGCPKCHSALQIGPALADKQLRCPQCRNPLTVINVQGKLTVTAVRSGSRPGLSTSPKPFGSSRSSIHLAMLFFLIPAVSGCSGCDTKPAPPPKPAKTVEKSDSSEPDVPEPAAEEMPKDSREEASANPPLDREAAEPDSAAAPRSDAPPLKSTAGRQRRRTPPDDQKETTPGGPANPARGAGTSGKKSADRSTGSGRSRRKRGPGSDPAAVARTAREKFENSQKKSAAGDHQGAYRDAAEAWEMVHSFESDAACSALASRIFSQLDSLADQANREAGGAERIRGSTLIEK